MARQQLGVAASQSVDTATKGYVDTAVAGVSGAPINSPAFTGTPTAPTAAAGTSTTQIATTAFVGTALGSYETSASATTAHNLKANLASPTFTGTVAAPTPATADSSTTVATTAFVKAQGYITSSSLGGYAPLASPTLTGTPAAPTAAAGTNTTQLATTAFVATGLAGKANSSHTHAGTDITSAVANATTAVTTSGNAATATALQTARTVQTNLASTASASFNGTAAITPGVTGTLPIANGGTGATTAAAALTALGAGKASTVEDTGWVLIAAPSGFTTGTTPNRLKYRVIKDVLYIMGGFNKSTAFTDGTYTTVTAAGAIPTQYIMTDTTGTAGVVARGSGAAAAAEIVLWELHSDGSLVIAWQDMNTTAGGPTWFSIAAAIPLD